MSNKPKEEAVNARGAGRPTLPDSERRDYRLEVRLTPAELRVVRRMCTGGVTMSMLVRRLLRREASRVAKAAQRA